LDLERSRYKTNALEKLLLPFFLTKPSIENVFQRCIFIAATIPKISSGNRKKGHRIVRLGLFPMALSYSGRLRIQVKRQMQLSNLYEMKERISLLELAALKAACIHRLDGMKTQSSVVVFSNTLLNELLLLWFRRAHIAALGRHQLLCYYTFCWKFPHELSIPDLPLAVIFTASLACTTNRDGCLSLPPF